MAIQLNGRKVSMFRCHLDPAIGVKPKNAFMVGTDGIKEAEITPAGVYVRWVNPSPGNDKNDAEHLVPYANIQSIKISPEEPKK